MERTIKLIVQTCWNDLNKMYDSQPMTLKIQDEYEVNISQGLKKIATAYPVDCGNYVDLSGVWVFKFQIKRNNNVILYKSLDLTYAIYEDMLRLAKENAFLHEIRKLNFDEISIQYINIDDGRIRIVYNVQTYNRPEIGLKLGAYVGFSRKINSLGNGDDFDTELIFDKRIHF